MPKGRFALALPIVQVLIAGILIHFGREIPVPKDIDTPYSPAIFQVCKGINAPAQLFTLALVEVIRAFRADCGSSPTILGTRLDEVLFFVNVFLLWFTCGWIIDQRRIRPRRPPVWGATIGVLFSLSVIVLGIFLFLVGVFPAWNPRDFQPGGRTMGLLFLLWSVVLITSSVSRLVRLARVRNPEREGSQYT